MYLTLIFFMVSEKTQKHENPENIFTLRFWTFFLSNFENLKKLLEQFFAFFI